MAIVILPQVNAWNVWGTQQVFTVKSVLMGTMGMQWLRKVAVVSCYYYSENVKNRKMWSACSGMYRKMHVFSKRVNLQVVSWQVQIESYEFWVLFSLRMEYILPGSDISYFWNFLACLMLPLQWLAVDIFCFWILHVRTGKTNFPNVPPHRVCCRFFICLA